ncbi:toxin-antitoxin system YwqK family antitoxin [Flavivirga abyssicola]|uniref:toxin-antitoxin system YwqK family antitoxin n=1 Tax=Flavivirga abyssicola TaxID=3063533 RepID=UPI0026E088F6|nr:toxin-antitoxin system YwqK family antitoxin [Flavivirga sp. MEBiC07777]WVK14621.1 toxin-antitoxin system YwqK family antitoxin [Flavivirga sp. MEBiC07777]
MKRVFLLTAILSVTISSAQREKKEYYDTGELKSVIEYNDNGFPGDSKYYYKNGNLEKTGRWGGRYTLGGIKTYIGGEWKYYHENGKLSAVGYFYDNEKTGEWKEYNKNGLLTGSFDFDSNKRKIYYETGQLRQEGSLINNKPHGECYVYYENGKLYAIQNFNNGKRNGLWKEYYENGNIKNEYNFESDKLDGLWTTYYEDGKLFTTREYVEHKLMNVLKLLNRNGDSLDTGTFKNGNGLLNVYNPEGKLEEQVTVKNGIFIQD